MRVFLDANILFSAAKTDGAIAGLLRRMLETGHQCVIDDFVHAEARRNLIAKGPDALVALEALVEACEIAATRPVPVTGCSDLDWLPEKDRPVLAAAIHSRCEALVTGDRMHFGSGYGRRFSGVTIHSPGSLFETLFR